MPLIKKTKNTYSDVVVWKVIESEAELTMMLGRGLVDIERLNAMKKDENKVQWLASRMALHKLLKDHAVPFEEIGRDEHGKPVLVGSDHAVSVSHTKGYTAALLGEHIFCGVDIETHFDQAHRVREKYMTEKELEYAGDDARKSALIWSAKEAIYKAYGKKGLIFKDDMQLKNVGEKELTMHFTPLDHDVTVSVEQEDDYIVTAVCEKDIS